MQKHYVVVSSSLYLCLASGFQTVFGSHRSHSKIVLKYSQAPLRGIESVVPIANTQVVESSYASFGDVREHSSGLTQGVIPFWDDKRDDFSRFTANGISAATEFLA
jgi:hypothetical protein